MLNITQRHDFCEQLWGEGKRIWRYPFIVATLFRDTVWPGKFTSLVKMAEKEIFCGIHYPVPVHLQNAYGSLGLSSGSCPVAEKCAEEFVSLPMFPELTESQIEYVATSIKEIMSNR